MQTQNRLNATQLETMLTLQNKMNSKVNPDWIAARSPFLRAVVVEGAEALEHHGWKWWKKQEKDLPQLQMELVDIWHFLLSHIILQKNGDLTYATKEIEQCFQFDKTVLIGHQTIQINTLDTPSKLELLIAVSAIRQIELPLFEALLTDCEMTWDELFNQYVSKNVLNMFRQDHGYKTDTYPKIWDGKEDNVHLVEIANALNPEKADYASELYNKLKERFLQTNP
jgi:hypothetical protein